jgi:hypothetical protein
MRGGKIRPSLFTISHGNHPAAPARRPEGRHRVLRRPRHQRRAPLDEAQGRASLRLHGQPRPARRARLRRDPAQGHGLRRREGAPRRLPRAARRRRHRGAASRRLPHHDGRRHLLQHDAAGPRGDRHHARRRDEGRRRQHLGRRQHVQGQRHRALLPLRPAREPEPEDLQAVAGPGLHRRARRACRDVGVHDPERLRLQDVGREGVFDRLEHAGRDPRGQGPRAAQQRHQDRAAHHGRRVLARRRRGQGRGGAGALRRRPAGRAQRRRVPESRRSDPEGQRDRRAPRPGHERPDREPHHRGEEPRHLRGARARAAVHRVRAAGHRHPQRRHDRAVPRPRPPPRPPAVPGPLVRPAGDHAARDCAALGRARDHGRGDARAAPRQRLLAAQHRVAEPDLQARAADDGKGRVDVLAGRPHRSADHAQPRHRRHAREARDLHEGRPPEGRQRRRTAAARDLPGR